MLRSAAGLVGLTFRNLYAGKRGYAVALLLVLPVVIAALGAISEKADGTKIYQDVVFHFSLQFVIFLLCLIYGISQTSGEIEDGTVGYLYLSAVPKWLIIMTQLLVTAATLTALLFASFFSTGAAASLSSKGMLQPFWRPVLGCTLVGGVGVLLCLSFYYTCGLGFRRPLAVAITATFFWELVIPFLPIRFTAYTVTTNLRALAKDLAFGDAWPAWNKYVSSELAPDYGHASMFLSILSALFLVTAMIAAMNRSVEGKEAR